MPEIPEVVAVTSDLESAGAIIYWRLSGTTKSEDLRAAWGKAQLKPQLLPEMPSVDVALRRAVGEQRQKRLLVRPLDGAKGWALVREDAKGESLSHQTEVTIRMQSGVLTFEPAEHDLRPKVVSAYDRHLTTFSAEDMSKWLCQLVRSLDAVSLREGGGIYFILHDKVDEWHRMIAAIRAGSGHTLFEIPAMHGEDAVVAVLDAVRREAEQEADTMETELDTEDLKPGALRSRQAKVQATAAKVARYERLLGVALPDLQHRLKLLNANLAEIALQASTEV